MDGEVMLITAAQRAGCALGDAPDLTRSDSLRRRRRLRCCETSLFFQKEVLENRATAQGVGKVGERNFNLDD